MNKLLLIVLTALACPLCLPLIINDDDEVIENES